MEVTYEMIKLNEEIKTYIEQADLNLEAIGYTEHGAAHIHTVAKNAGKILTEFGYSQKEAELAKVAGYMHDIGNVVNRADHAQSGALMAFNILRSLDIDAKDISVVCAAIGNHDEGTANPVNSVAAALIIADKCDVRRNRVRKEMLGTPSAIHYNVNYSVSNSKLILNKEDKTITLDLTIDTALCSVMDYFEIFLKRMKLCKTCAEKLGAKFVLIINGQLHS